MAADGGDGRNLPADAPESPRNPHKLRMNVLAEMKLLEEQTRQAAAPVALTIKRNPGLSQPSHLAPKLRLQLRRKPPTTRNQSTESVRRAIKDIQEAVAPSPGGESPKQPLTLGGPDDGISECHHFAPT